jgi:hypothetical protein
MPTAFAFRRVVAVALLAFTGATAWAGPGYYVVTTYEDEGKKLLDFKFWAVKESDGAPVTWPEVGLGYNVTKRWFTELYLGYINTPDGTGLADINWQNDYLLTQGQYWFDLALHTNLKIHNNPPHGYEDEFNDQLHGFNFEFGPVFQTELGARTQLNANLFFERNYHGIAPAPNPMQLKYQWQVKYRWSPQWGFGAQGFGELGPWDNWAPSDQQSHRAGPAVFAHFPLGGKQELSAEAAMLFGSVFGYHVKMFTARVRYEF